MGGAWLNGAESRIALERRRGAEGHAETQRRDKGVGSTDRRRKRVKRKGERELPGRNKLARNERQIASELSARSPDVIEAAMLLPPPPSFLLSVSVSRSLSPTFYYDWSLFSLSCLSLALFTPSFVPWTTPLRDEKRDQGSSSQVRRRRFSSVLPLLSLSFSFFRRYLYNFILSFFLRSYVLPAILMDVRRPTGVPPRHLIDRLCPHRENSRTTLVSLFRRILAWQVHHFVAEGSTALPFFAFFCDNAPFSHAV